MVIGQTKASKKRVRPPPGRVSFDAVIYTRYARKSASQIVVLSRMQSALHATRRTPHGASRLVLAMSSWSVKTRRAPSGHCKDAKTYGHTPTATHDNEYTPSPASMAHTSMIAEVCR